MNELKSQHPSIKFEDHRISHTEVNFFDTTVYIDRNSNLQITLYKRP